ncbi:hypothetical protein QYE76_014970 [Lolium multiflorum]|uniref:Uncharacterized protein n=1 Tax=Lolium multiflorum TaxID=4521 RepID=A0AAD8U5J6_LOLMU|nr:hypothetical protein QYE76_014970 [Lolium multiflorum]
MLVMTGHAKKLSDLGIVIPNRLGINCVLQSLPPSYKNFVMNYNMQNMNKELPELFGMLKAAEIEIKKEHQVLMVNKTTSFKKQGKSKGKFKKGGKKAATPPMKPKNGPKPDAECYYCKEKGHWKRNCSKYLADLKSGLVKKKKEEAEADLAAVIVVVVVAAAELNARLPRRRLHHRRRWTWSRTCGSSSSSSSRATRAASRGCRTPSPTTSGDDRPRTIHLREAACGYYRWIVDVIYDARGKMYLNIGWEKFARHHSLQAGLLFSYFGDRDMSVKVFDETRCRRDYQGDNTDEEDD